MQHRFAAWLATFAFVWQALMPFVSLAAADPQSGHVCPTTGLHSVSLGGGDDDDPSNAGYLRCGYCVSVQGQTIEPSALPEPFGISGAAFVVHVPEGDGPRHSFRAAAPLPPRGPPRLS